MAPLDQLDQNPQQREAVCSGELAIAALNEAIRLCDLVLAEAAEETCHCGNPVCYGFDGDPTHHRGMCFRCEVIRCDAYPDAHGPLQEFEGVVAQNTPATKVYSETLSTIFLDLDNPAAGTLAEFPDGSWVVDLPSGPIERETLRSLAWTILELTE